MKKRTKLFITVSHEDICEVFNTAHYSRFIFLKHISGSGCKVIEVSEGGDVCKNVAVISTVFILLK